jgi:hypothetical protein
MAHSGRIQWQSLYCNPPTPTDSKSLFSGLPALDGESILGNLRLPSSRRSKVLLSHDGMPSDVREQVWYVQWHSKRNQEYVFWSHPQDRRSHSCREVGIEVAICRSTLYWMPGTEQCWSVPMKLRLKVDRRLCFVRFCHALPLVDQQGCFYPY